MLPSTPARLHAYPPQWPCMWCMHACLPEAQHGCLPSVRACTQQRHRTGTSSSGLQASRAGHNKHITRLAWWVIQDLEKPSHSPAGTWLHEPVGTRLQELARCLLSASTKLFSEKVMLGPCASRASPLGCLHAAVQASWFAHSHSCT